MIFETKRCIVCDESSYIELDDTKYDCWRSGKLVQTLWKDWSPSQRELLITGTHPQCWELMMNDEEGYPGCNACQEPERYDEHIHNE